ncbi:MAG TPA: alpha/beta fold hydrolase [Spirochaetia bacterium]|nr:alpha/beta fold hydrolase [Spirochaetia bacterium]
MKSRSDGRAALLALLLGLVGCRTVTETEGDRESPAMEQTVIVDNMLIRYRTNEPSGSVRAAGATTPILMIHGWMGSSYDYQQLLDLLPASIQAVAPDMPGSGESEKRNVKYTMDFFVDFIDHFLEALSMPTVVLVGHSFGGAIAVHYAATRPDRVSRLVLIDPDGLSREEGFLDWLRRREVLVDLLSALNNRAAVSLALRLQVFHHPTLVTKEMVAAVERTGLEPDGRRAQRELAKRVVGRYPVDALLPGLQMPVLLIWGRNDRVLSSKWAARFMELLPDARLEMVDECGHMPQIEAVRRVADLLLADAE